MTRYASHIVPPIPDSMSHDEGIAWTLWRRGYPISKAAEKAGIAPNHLRRLLGMQPLPEISLYSKPVEVRT